MHNEKRERVIMSKPARLRKVEDTSDDKINEIFNRILNKFEGFVLSHAMLFLIISICLLISLFIGVIFTMTGVSAVESGMLRNFINGGHV